MDWEANSEPDLAGYNVYRSSDNVTFVKVNIDYVTTNSYYDHGLTNGTTYYYKITAIHTSDNESPFSAVANNTCDADTDGDGTFNLEDYDDDNDGLSDIEEDVNGNGIVDTGETDPLDTDTDGDGYNDKEDAYPLDPTRWIDIPQATVDYIQIVDTPISGITKIPDHSVIVNFTLVGYAAAFNNSAGYLWDVDVIWSVENSGGAQATFDPSLGNSSIFNSGRSGGMAIWTAEYEGIYTDSVMLTIRAPRVDYIVITQSTGGVAMEDQAVPVGFTITGYASAFNLSSGFIDDISVTWAMENSSGALATSSDGSGKSEIFNSGLSGGTAVWTADDGQGHTDTVVFTILPPVVDSIRIEDEEGNEITEIHLQSGESLTVYVLGSNNTVGSIGHVSVSWNVSGGASLSTTSGTSTTITAGDEGGTFTITAEYSDDITISSPLEVSEKADEELSMWWVIPIIVIILLLLLLFVLKRMKKKEYQGGEEENPEKAKDEPEEGIGEEKAKKEEGEKPEEGKPEVGKAEETEMKEN